MAAKTVSKNQRVGAKQVPKKSLCAQGHERRQVLIVGQGMNRLCECDGYKPIDTTQPYNSRTAKFKVGGNSRIWYEEVPA